jgi:hypothetical protein
MYIVPISPYCHIDQNELYQQLKYVRLHHYCAQPWCNIVVVRVRQQNEVPKTLAGEKGAILLKRTQGATNRFVTMMCNGTPQFKLLTRLVL